MARHERAHPNARNFGLRSRDMYRAGREALYEGIASYSTRATMADRWRQFCEYAKRDLGLSDMRCIEVVHLDRYAAYLHERLDRGEIGSSTAQNCLSTVNRIMEIARGDRRVRLDPVRGAGLPQRSGIAIEQNAMPQSVHDRLKEVLPDRIAAQLDLQRLLGLRFEESAKIDACGLLSQAQNRGSIRIEDGTKGGRSRIIPLTSDRQLEALRRAAEIQGAQRSLIPSELDYSHYRESCYQYGIRFHSERHAYAQDRYAVLAGASCPLAAGVAHGRPHHTYLAQIRGLSVAEARELDRAVRMQIAEELGHGRTDITNCYLG